MTCRVFSRREFGMLAASGLLSACEVGRPRLPAPPRPVAPVRLLIRSGRRVDSIPLEDYVLGSVLAEVTPVGDSPAAAERIFQVQAIVARSYAAAYVGRHRAEGFDLCDAVHCQAFDLARLRSSRFAAAARAAVRSTAGIILVHANRPASALFHADCGGHTAAADAVWGGPSVPYLVSARDAVPRARHRDWTLALSADELLAILNRDGRTRVGRKLTRLEVRQRDASGRAAQVALAGEMVRAVRGELLRTVLNQRLGDKALRSTRFTVRRKGSSYEFRGTGFGHGVGLCQLGAAARARRGESIEEILGAYFKGAGLARAMGQ